MSTPLEYDIGDVAVLRATFTIDDVLTTPTTATLVVLLPDGTTTSPTPTTPSTGVKRAEVPITMSGNWHYRWVGTGAAAGAAEGVLVVRRSSVL